MSPERKAVHILFVSSWWPRRNKSAGTFVELHLKALQSMGCKCSVLLTGEITLGNYLRSGFRSDSFEDYRRSEGIRFINNLVIHKKPLTFVENKLLFRKENICRTTKRNFENYIAKHGKPDFIFHHGVFDFVYLSEFISSEFEIPIVFMENSPNMSVDSIPIGNPFDTRKSVTSFVKKASKRFAVTQAYVDQMTNLFESKFELCPNVLSDDFFKSNRSDSGKNKADQIFQFVNVGILDPRKNQDFLIRAFAKAFGGQPNFLLKIAGDGRLKDDLEKTIRELNLSQQVEILGFQTRDQIKELLDNSHCFVLSSHSETFGVVVIEAMARGIPVISSDIPGTNELLTKDCGIIYTPDSERELMDAMIEVHQRREEFQAERIVSYARRNYGPEASFKVLIENLDFSENGAV